MTTFQDPPLQSRRAARQGDRPESSTPPFTPPQTPRTAAGAGEPLSYVTQNRPPLPGYEAPRGRRATEPAPAAPETAPAAEPAQSFRPRDFSPEARTAPPAWAPEYDRESGVVEFRTQARATVAPAAASLAESLANEPSEQTLTRRELRQIRDAHRIATEPTDPAPAAPAPQQFAPAASAPAPAAPAPAPVAPAPAPVAPAPGATLDSAMAEFDALTSRSADAPPRRGGRRAAPTAEPEAVPAVAQQPIVAHPDTEQPAAQQPVAEQTVAQQPVAEQPVAPAFGRPAGSAQPATPAPQQYQQPDPVAPQPAEQQVAPAPLPEPVAPTTGERPVGHWTTQADLDDAVQVSESSISRTIGAGSGAITTSALVLPSLPGQDMTTGEVMLTGSINLPSALSETGAHTALDESDLDHLLDPGDHQLVNTDSVPIRAIKAVSSHSGSRAQLIGTGKPPKSANRALTALIVSASGMVVVVVTLLVVAIATDVL